MENKQKETGLTFDAAPSKEASKPVLGWKEKQYEKLRGKISVKALDIIIAVLVIAFIVTVVLGVLDRK